MSGVQCAAPHGTPCPCDAEPDLLQFCKTGAQGLAAHAEQCALWTARHRTRVSLAAALATDLDADGWRTGAEWHVAVATQTGGGHAQGRVPLRPSRGPPSLRRGQGSGRPRHPCERGGRVRHRRAVAGACCLPHSGHPHPTPPRPAGALVARRRRCRRRPPETGPCVPPAIQARDPGALVRHSGLWRSRPRVGGAPAASLARMCLDPRDRQTRRALCPSRGQRHGPAVGDRRVRCWRPRAPARATQGHRHPANKGKEKGKDTTHTHPTAQRHTRPGGGRGRRAGQHKATGREFTVGALQHLGGGACCGDQTRGTRTGQGRGDGGEGGGEGGRVVDRAGGGGSGDALEALLFGVLGLLIELGGLELGQLA